jgi:hypothetical protein
MELPVVVAGAVTARNSVPGSGHGMARQGDR